MQNPHLEPYFAAGIEAANEHVIQPINEHVIQPINEHVVQPIMGGPAPVNQSKEK